MMYVFMLMLTLASVTTPVRSLKCWLCKASNNGPTSFAECDANKMEEKCGSKNGVPACGMFIYKSKTDVLIHAKSCVYQHYCGANGTFCQNIQLGGSDCGLECCDTELCNYKESFKPTTPGPTTSGPTTPNKTTPEINTERDTTIHGDTTTEKQTTTPTDTTRPTHETPAPDYDDEDDDCSWIDAGSTHLSSGVLLVACATSALLYHPALLL